MWRSLVARLTGHYSSSEVSGLLRLGKQILHRGDCLYISGIGIINYSGGCDQNRMNGVFGTGYPCQIHDFFSNIRIRFLCYGKLVFGVFHFT